MLNPDLKLNRSDEAEFPHAGGSVADSLLAELFILARESMTLTLSDINSRLPVNFTVEMLERLFENLWDNGITVVDEHNGSLNIEPFLRDGELSRPLQRDDDEEQTSELLKSPVRSWLAKVSEIDSSASHTYSSSSEELADDTIEPLSKLIHSHLSLVIKIARRYKRSGVSFDELILAGNEGLVEAAAHYERTSRKTFASCARWWIGHYLSKCISENWRASRIPRTVAVNLRKMARVVARYRGKRGRDPSPEFLSRALSIPVDEIFFLKGLFESPLSLYGPAAAESADVILVDTIEDKAAVNGEDMIDSACIKETVLSLLYGLDSLSSQVLSLRFGLDDGISKSINEVAELLAISADDVRMIEKRGIDELRKHHSSSVLNGLL